MTVARLLAGVLLGCWLVGCGAGGRAACPADRAAMTTTTSSVVATRGKEDKDFYVAPVQTWGAAEPDEDYGF